MEIEVIIRAILETINPSLLFPNLYIPFFNQTYTYLFLANLIIFMFFLFSNKQLVGYAKRLVSSSKRITLIVLGLILAFHIANNIYSMEPLNNLVPSSCDISYKAHLLLTEGYVSYTEWATRPLGASMLAAMIKIITDIDFIYILSALGIFVSCLTMFLIFITIKHLTKRDAIAILGCLAYVLLPLTTYLSSSHVETMLFSSFFVLLLFFLYSTDNETCGNADSIIFCSTLSLFFREENVVFIPLLMFYLARKWKWLNKRMMLIKLATAYLFMITVTVLIMSPLSPLLGAAHTISYLGIQSKSISFYTLLVSTFSFMLSLAFVLGVAYLLIIKKGYYSMMVFSMLLITYLFYPYISFRAIDFFILVPTAITLIGCGVFLVYNLNRRLMWKIVVAAIFLVLILAGLKAAPFSKIPTMEGYTPMVGEDIINNSNVSKIILYDKMRNAAFCLRRFYNFTTDVAKKLDCTDVIDELYPHEGDYIVEKYGYSSFSNTNLLDILYSIDRDTIIVTGTVTQICVEDTVHDAFHKRIKVIVASDAVSSFDKELHDAALKNIGMKYGAVMDSDSLISMLKRA